MEILSDAVKWILHLDHHLNSIIAHFGVWAYGLFFLIIFAETGLVVTPFLPGDSLLFALGTFAGAGFLDIYILIALLVFAAISGDSANYAIGKYFGTKMLEDKKHHLIKPEHIERTHHFYEKYGAKTIVLARFVPIVRTLAPFVAGAGRMSYSKFLFYNVTGGILWITIFVLGGFYFGNMEFVKENFTIVIFVIIIVSVLPGVFEFLRHKLRAKSDARA